jgi:hypothetical protein
MIQFLIKGNLAKLNDHDNANRRNRFAGAKLKHDMTELVRAQVVDSPWRVTKPCYIRFTWYVSGRHDYDNVRFSAKYVLDGMVKAEVLVDDKPKWVLGFAGDSFIKVDKGHEGVLVEIQEEE